MKKFSKIIVSILSLVIISTFVLACDLDSKSNKTTKKDDYNYYTSVYSNLNDSDNVFESITHNGLSKLLNLEGNFLVLFGGAYSESLQESISYINDVAKERNIRKIYVFDFKLDGGIGETLDGNISADISSENHEYNYLYKNIVDLLSNYEEISGNTQKVTTKIYNKISSGTKSFVSLNNKGSYEVYTGDVYDATPSNIELPKIKTPTLIAYNKANKVERVSKPIIALDDSAFKAGDLSSNAENRNVYIQKLNTFFDTLKDSNRGSGTDTIRVETYDYYSEETMHLASSTNYSPYATKEHILQAITYHELIDMFNKKADFVVFFGGQWCPNTQAMATYVNEYAKKAGLEKVYIFDTRLDGLSGQLYGRLTTGVVDLSYTVTEKDAETGEDIKVEKNDGIEVTKTNSYFTTHTNIRGNFYSDTTATIASGVTRYARLYKHLLSFIPNFSSNWNSNDYTTNSTVTIDDEKYTRICVPAVLLYSKDRVDESGNKATVVGSYEAEYVWSNTQDPYNIHSINIKAGLQSVFNLTPDYLKVALEENTSNSSNSSSSTSNSGGGSSTSGGAEEIC